jgi:hypothetical protein
MGPCIAGGAYLPALSDLIVMVKGTSFMGLGGPNLVKGATGQTIDGETLGGAVTHTEISGVAHYAADDDEACLAKLRDLVAMLPAGRLAVDGKARHLVLRALTCTSCSRLTIACRTTCIKSFRQSSTTASSTNFNLTSRAR